MQSYNHFTLSERESLRIFLEQGFKYREIARAQSAARGTGMLPKSLHKKLPG